jgi:hypothetical protein
MVKLGAMKLFGPSKEEKQAEEAEHTKKSAVIETAQEKLYGGLGFDGDGGLTRLLKGLDHLEGKGIRESEQFVGSQTTNYALAKAATLESYGVSVDRSAIKEGGDVGQAAIADITRQLGTMIDAYKMQEKTGIDQNAVPTVGQQPQIEEPPTNTGVAQNTLAEFKPESQSMGAELDMPTLLAELVRLQTENNRLLKKEIDSINSLDV